MYYTLTISKSEKNPDYEEQTSRTLGYARSFEDVRPEYFNKNLTFASLTEEQWKKVQKAIIETME